MHGFVCCSAQWIACEVGNIDVFVRGGRRAEEGEGSPLSLTMNTSLSVSYAQSRGVLVPPVCSKMPMMPILRIGKVTEIILGFSTSRYIRQQRIHSPGHSTAAVFDEADRVGSYRDDQGLCGPVGGHCVGVILPDSSEARCPKGEECPNDERGEDRLKDEVGDEHAGEELNLRSVPEGFDDVRSSMVTNNERVEELAKVVNSLRQSLQVFTDQLETLVRLNKTPSGQSGMRNDELKSLKKIHTLINENDLQTSRSRVESRKSMQKRGPQRFLTGRAGSRRQNVQLNEDMAATEKIKADDERFMGEALVEAKKAAMAGEVPVGAVIVQEGKIFARAYNRVESAGDPTAHAEMLCLRSAARHHGNWRLLDATLYVTLEPCAMCAGAILQSRVKGVVWGSRNTLLGADGSWVSLFPELAEDEIDADSKSEQEPCNRPLAHPFHTSLEVRREVLADDCSTVMRSFFKARRKVNGNSVKTKPWWLPLPAWVLFKRLLQCLASSVKV